MKPTVSVVLGRLAPARDMLGPQPGDNQSSRAPGCHSLLILIFVLALVLAGSGQCVNDCAIEHGICVSSCQGSGGCISSCASALNRCVARCYAANDKGIFACRP